ncbi:MAG: hypothetical protein HFJ60_04830 [Clostridia bacterium]|jgi:DNA primase|nr:hypothetical protein [Clostridia bacterium]
MNKIQEVKQRADIVKVAEYFGIKKKQCCPFHNEKTASFSISQSKQIFHCFGCGVGGDCITLVSKLLNINAYESAKQINNIFSLGINFNGYTPKYEVNRYKQIQEAKEKFKIWHNETLQLLCKYLHSLQGIKKLQEQEVIEYYIDLLIFGTEEDWIWFKKTEERWCKEIERRIKSRVT